MDKKQLEAFRKKLGEQKEIILKGSTKTLNTEMVVPDEELPDTIDRSSIETDRNFTLRLRDRDRKLLKKVEQALARIESNTFGTCEDCGGKIQIRRLEARAVATLCISCKEEEEEREKKLRLA